MTEALEGIINIAGPLLSSSHNLDSFSNYSNSIKKNASPSQTSASSAITQPTLSAAGCGPLSPTLESSLAALMVTLGSNGFMIMRRCRLGAEDAPLLPSLSPHRATNVNHHQRFMGDDARYKTGCSNMESRDETMADEGGDTKPRVVGLYFSSPSLHGEIVSVSGAGDCLASGFIAGMLAGLSVSECATVGNTAAEYSLLASPSVPTTLSKLQVTAGSSRLLSYTLIY